MTFKHKGNQPNLDSFPSFGHPATTLPRPLSPQNIFYDDTSFSLEEQIYPLGKKSKSLSHSQNFYPMNVSTLGTEQQVYLHGIPPSMNQCNPNCSNNNDSFKISFLSGDKVRKSMLLSQFKTNDFLKFEALSNSTPGPISVPDGQLHKTSNNFQRTSAQSRRSRRDRMASTKIR